ncbi:MAG: NAD(P)/FAD-dependent oxidoreductase [Microvirga sp.]
MRDELLDCLVIGGGPAGLTAALYLARFERRVVVIDAGAPRADWIPTRHNIHYFVERIGGPEILERQRAHVRKYGVAIRSGTVTDLRKHADRFMASIDDGEGGPARPVAARRILLATGAVDVEPDLPDMPNAVQRGLVRYCPICDGNEARHTTIAVIGHGDHGMGEAIFIARTYTCDVTLLTLGRPMQLTGDQRRELESHGIGIVEEPIEALDIQDDRIAALRSGGRAHRFDVLYSALGLRYRSELALALGAERDENGALRVDEHCQTTVKGLYAAGDVVRGLDQIVLGMGHAATAATHIHNRCELPTEDEPGGA